MVYCGRALSEQRNLVLGGKIPWIIMKSEQKPVMNQNMMNYNDGIAPNIKIIMAKCRI